MPPRLQLVGRQQVQSLIQSLQSRKRIAPSPSSSTSSATRRTSGTSSSQSSATKHGNKHIWAGVDELHTMLLPTRAGQTTPLPVSNEVISACRVEAESHILVYKSPSKKKLSAHTTPRPLVAVDDAALSAGLGEAEGKILVNRNKPAKAQPVVAIDDAALSAGLGEAEGKILVNRNKPVKVKVSPPPVKEVSEPEKDIEHPLLTDGITEAEGFILAQRVRLPQEVDASSSDAIFVYTPETPTADDFVYTVEEASSMGNDAVAETNDDSTAAAGSSAPPPAATEPLVEMELVLIEDDEEKPLESLQLCPPPLGQDSDVEKLLNVDPNWQYAIPEIL